MVRYINLLKFIFTYESTTVFKDLLPYKPTYFTSQIPSYWGVLDLTVGPNILAFYNTCYRIFHKFKICLMRILQECIKYIKQVSPVSGNNLNSSSGCY